MALDFKRWVLQKLGAGSHRVSTSDITAAELFGLSSEIYVRELAFWSCVNLIANAVSKCEFKTFSKNKEVKGSEYYSWNISPNKNQNSSAFIHKWIAQLYRNNEALIVETADGQRLVADSYDRKQYALYDDVFSQVTVGDYTFNRPFMQSEVIFIELSEKNMRPLINGLYDVYQKLIDYSMKSYRKSRGQKGVLSIDTIAAGDAKMQETFNDIKNNGFAKFADAENGILSLWKGMNYTDLGNKTYSNEGTRDIRAMIDDVSDFTARAFGVPPALLSGDVQGVSDALDQFLTFCIDPLTDMLSEEINRKVFSQKDFLDGDYIKIDTKCIKHVDLLSVSTAIDKLISSGAFCVNDIRELVGEPPIDEEWANRNWMTKNYSPIETLLNIMQTQNKQNTE